MSHRSVFTFAVCLMLCADFARCAPPLLSATPWPDATELFRRDPRWLGGDAAYSVDLGKDRILWLFGDSFIASGKSLSRAGATMIRNSIAIQLGSDPAEAKMRFYWRENALGRPSSFFPGTRDSWLWPGHGIRIDDRLVVFFALVHQTKENDLFGFRSIAWRAVLIDGIDSVPMQWRMRMIPCPPAVDNIMVGSASVIAIDGYVYAFSSKETGGHPAYLVRWKRDDLYNGRLARMEWWSGRKLGYRVDTAQACKLFDNGQTEFSVHYERRIGRWIQFQGEGFGMCRLCYRTAPALEGPWSGLRDFYEAPDKDRRDLFLYAVKAHPAINAGRGNIAVSYVTNAFSLDVLLNDTSCYFPRMLQVTPAVAPDER